MFWSDVLLISLLKAAWLPLTSFALQFFVFTFFFFFIFTFFFLFFFFYSFTIDSKLNVKVSSTVIKDEL